MLHGLFDVREKMREMGPATRRLFGQVEAIVSLVLVCPVTSYEVKRSFTAMHIVKPRLRSCVGQVLFNSSVMCAVHCLDGLEVDSIASEWAKFNKSCARVFGNMYRYERQQTQAQMTKTCSVSNAVL